MTVNLVLGAAQVRLDAQTPRVFAGRDPQTCQLAHMDATLSRRHAEIWLASDGNTYLRAEPLTDPDTGLTIGLRDHYDNNTGTRYVNLECNYGYSKGITDGLRVLKRLD